MALVFTSSVPKFRITFNQAGTTNTLSFEDLIKTSYAAYGTVSNFKALLKVTDPSGIIIYQNTGWSTTAPNFTSPDIKGAATAVWTKTGITLPSAVKTGTYTIEYIASIDASGDPTRTNFVYVSKTYNYQAVMPTISIEYDVSCRTSEITSTDATDYDIVVSGVSYPATVTRTHTLYKPDLAGCNSPSAVTTAALTWGGGGTALTDLWTGTWRTAISTAASYDMETWGAYTWVVISATLTGADTVDVTCDNCFCDLRVCMENLFLSWQAAVGTNLKREAELRTKVLKVLTEWVDFQGAEMCGDLDEQNDACEAIRTILRSENCTCPDSTDSAPEHVVAWGSGSGQAAASTFAFSVSAVDPTGGNTGDMHYNTATYHIWRKDAGGWTDYGSIQGAAGAAGADGENQSILEHDYADHACDASGATQTLYSYTMPGDTVASNGDVIKISLLYQLAANSNGKTCTLQFGGTDVLTYFTDSLVNADNNMVRLEAFVTRTGAVTQDIEVIATRSGVASPKHSFTTGTADFTATIDIDANCLSATSTASDITLKDFRIEYFKIIV
jgi:hypothetical protein